MHGYFNTESETVPFESRKPQSFPGYVFLLYKSIMCLDSAMLEASGLKELSSNL